MTVPVPQLITVDIAVFNSFDRRLLFIRRCNEPFKDQLAFPGGFVEPDETILNAAMRELNEETSLQAFGKISLIGVASEPGRDPRGRVVSVIFMALIDDAVANTARAADDAKEIVWLTVEQAAREGLAFDHNEILLNVISKLPEAVACC